VDVGAAAGSGIAIGRVSSSGLHRGQDYRYRRPRLRQSRIAYSAVDIHTTSGPRAPRRPREMDMAGTATLTGPRIETDPWYTSSPYEPVEASITRLEDVDLLDGALFQGGSARGLEADA
jgi:hypothetical protein